jgi:hypothetical protein
MKILQMFRVMLPPDPLNNLHEDDGTRVEVTMPQEYEILQGSLHVIGSDGYAVHRRRGYAMFHAICETKPDILPTMSLTKEVPFIWRAPGDKLYGFSGSYIGTIMLGQPSPHMSLSLFRYMGEDPRSL